MSVKRTRPSWVDLMDEEEKLLKCDSKLVSNINCNVACDADTNPTPSKLLANELCDVHLITPSKNEPATVTTMPITFSIDDVESIKVDSEVSASKGGSQNEGFEQPNEQNATIQIKSDNDDKSRLVNIRTENDNLAKDDVPRAVTPLPSTNDVKAENKTKYESSKTKLKPPIVRSANEVSNTKRRSSRNNPAAHLRLPRSDEMNDNDRSRKRQMSVSSATSKVESPQAKKRAFEIETDVKVLERRQKQINYGKNTVGYQRYLQQIPKNKRTSEHPQTPQKQLKYSRRAFDGLIKIWRQGLHNWDSENEVEPANSPDSDSNEPSLDESLLLTD